MTVFKASSDQIEILGAAIIPVLKGIPVSSVSSKLLQEYHLENPVADQYYNQQQYLDLLKKINTYMDMVLFGIGQNIFLEAVFPPDIDTFEKVFLGLDQAYHLNHRGGEIGHYNTQKIDEQSYLADCDNPYPCNFDQGIIQGIAKYFNQRILIEHQTEACRMKGDEHCIYEISVL